jgi:hypothetical protein
MEKCTQGTTRNSMLCRKLIEIRSWQNANVKESRRVLRRRQVVKSRLPRLLRKNLPLRKLKKANRKISSLQTKDDSESESSTSGGDEPSNNGGNSFGGREEKKKGKKSKKE